MPSVTTQAHHRADAGLAFDEAYDLVSGEIKMAELNDDKDAAKEDLRSALHRADHILSRAAITKAKREECLTAIVNSLVKP